MQFGLTYSVTCQTYWVIWDFPVLSPDRDILCFAQERLIEPSIIRSNFVLINRLHRERLLFLGQEVDSEISNQLVGLMVYLSIEDDTRDLYLFINSPGGWVIPGIAIYDTMQFVPPDVHTICMGLAASMGSFILAPTGEFILEAEELLKLRETLTRVYVQRTGNPLWVVSEDMERDVFMSATEAQDYGIVDLVAIENTGDFA
ncbi:clp protease proteolytic subunit chloroplast [Cinnamomum micranthum f. kanehirae]|uniref:ATP-dependent Clp protease proteolytic subunit n=1 Tax=Cinnamomum micranthum f. kanehirae TaxID=337451 RepID=A0A443Q4E3_9MAGN|nr:clp protease proteolytic subunit chloroplast [Cinnamomum micranthum f. kanehirae]